MKAIGNNLIVNMTKQGVSETKGGLFLAEKQREDIKKIKKLKKIARSHPIIYARLNFRLAPTLLDAHFFSHSWPILMIQVCIPIL